MNVPITTLTGLSAVGKEFGQTTATADDTASLPRMPVSAFRAWLERADPGASLEYHRGFLICDRGPGSELPKERRSALAKVADAALNAAEKGRVHLVQRRNDAFDFSYLAIKAFRPPNGYGVAATEEYFEAEDAIGRWLDDCCLRGRNHAETSEVLFASWKAWAEASGEFAGSKRRLSDLLVARGFANWRHPETDRRGFRGLKPRDETRSPNDLEF
jgi:hypothetical protein